MKGRFKNKKGFTLIELIIVIVVLGILATVVAPKFMGIQKDAKVSVVKALYGSIKTSMQMVKAKWYILGDQSYDNVTLDDGSVVKVYANGHPNTAPYYSTLYGLPYLSDDGLPKAVDYDDKRFDENAGTNSYVRFYYKGSNAGLVNTDESTGCGIFCRRESVSVNGQNRGSIKCYINTGGCD